MYDRHLFLFGGSPPFTRNLAEKFGSLIPNNKPIAILFVDRPGWQAYMPKYTDALTKWGDSPFTFHPMTDDGNCGDFSDLQRAGGIVIGGGDTVKYHQHIIDTQIGTLIREKYSEGIPIAGFSAGALISPAHCIIPPIDNDWNEHLFLKGLGLVNHCVISVHYRKWDEEANLKAAIHQTKSPVGYGIDDEAGIYFHNEELAFTEGFMTHFEK
ncbi:Type 1 glutamine amidotransferase-like domain-containing protein [Falsibacillus albus]|uniref:Peptidase S51 dipeptidase E n=1 Tax=Falsibacillus albus TaxID=2478915 RepID=A0A3L7JSL9_9BACI|nr:Type 1 glutamine amidotransferase-like domain-containing protein [Falsibacillus albus]RLQ93324.1 peptidase S51 dipeptidase E [Falsibacillus albus]